MERKSAALLSVLVAVKPVVLTVLPCLLTALVSLVTVSPAACDDDLRSLELFNGTQTGFVSGNRSPRPASQTAENITVVTAEEIAALNAHTLIDVLYAVTGVQVETNRTPGTAAHIEIQGSNFDHVQVLIDNVPINNLADNYPDLASVPAQIIERVEIVKGAASSSWGSALGGVLNIITKSPQQERAFGGMLSASYGSRETLDGRGEATGTVDRFGYYLSGGKIRSDGLLPNNEADLRNLYAKLRYDLPGRGSVTSATWYGEGFSGMTAFSGMDVDLVNRSLISSLSLQYPLLNRLTVDASLRTRQAISNIFAKSAASGEQLQSTTVDDTANGGSLKLSWLGEWQMVVAGVDYDHVKARVKGSAFDGSVRSADRIGFYLNDTVTIGAFAITPSVRYDDTGFGEDHFSPSLGVTYAVGENTVLRGYTTRGYSLTSLNRPDSTEKVWTSQLGLETGEVPYFWLKGTAFRNDTWDIVTFTRGGLKETRQLKQGFELEARTLPVLNTSLSAGYTFIHATEGENGPTLAGVPKHTLKLVVKYRDPNDLQGELVGHYINWNEPDGRYGATLWDLHLRKSFSFSEYGSFELFASVRNIFNSDQYLTELFRNSGRWAEAGVKCNF